jgi:hypothetical protein
VHPPVFPAYLAFCFYPQQNRYGKAYVTYLRVFLIIWMMGFGFV